VPAADAARVSHLPPVATLFSSFLGYNPMATLLGKHVLSALPAAQAHTLTGRTFFPKLITGPFHTALVYAFVFAIACCLVAAVASLLRGGKYHHVEQVAGTPTGIEPVEVAA
jgi:MFS superfamily sulfate permease-like transporter